MKSTTYFLLRTLLLLFVFTAGSALQAQCAGTANLPPAGTVTINGVQITTTNTKGSANAVTTYGSAYSICGNNTSANSLWTGWCSSPDNSTSPGSACSTWSVTFTFDQPVNDVVFVITAGGNTFGGVNGPTNTESFTFNTNQGVPGVTISNSCYTTVSGNTVSQYNGGGANVKIHSITPFTQITANGTGGYGGALWGLCTTSIVASPTISGITPASQTVCANTAPSAISAISTNATTYQWYSNTTNSNVGGTAISGANSVSYTPSATGTLGNRYFYVVASNSGGGTATSPVATVTTQSCCPAGNTPPAVN